MIDFTAYNLAGFVGLSLIVLAATAAVGGRRQSPWPQRLLLAGVGFRILGALVRYEVLFGFYDGGGDATTYYLRSLPIADSIRALEASPFTASFWTAGGLRWGTGFVTNLSGLIVAFLGPSLRAEFLVFSLLAFGGLLAIAKAFNRLQPDRSIAYAAWIWVWPSLWFWPSSVGKEAVILLALGLGTLGYVGSGAGIRWAPLVAGIGLAFLIRPHVAAVIAISVVVAEWLNSWGRTSPRRIFEGLALLALSVVLLLATIRQFGLERPELEGVVEFVEWERGQTLQGGSNVGAVALGPSGVLAAFVNIWMRPFPWEAHNLTALVAALEIAAFWVLVAYRRRALMLALKHWRSHRMLRFSLPLLVAYTLMIGMTFGNLGIIARQRAPIFPFMLVFVLAVPPAPAPSRSPVNAPLTGRREAAIGQGS